MYRLIVTLILSAHLLMPIAAYAQSAVQSPLDTPIGEYGLTLAVAVFGGVVSWIAKVRSGELPVWSLAQLIGEIATSAFAGMLTFWALRALHYDPNIIAAMVGMSGYAGSKLLAIAERTAQKYAERRLGIEADKGAP
jgi:NhaP-type Na+/H+ and K+/H+ antiporter